ncbi:MAG: RNA polymerase sigma factor [Ilumatobacter sp.]|uniref:RNA polymerase sigma factor n=1 Tax=Ilumatobacter sp. TaxID=1967498 RepID=UPI002635D17F|nr:RNA polymerase sigma factor [Ilumatobacter sp.]MDJ0767670.1 RNA polymerase sigma factor [Ilumatobacter sp.]
MSATDAEVIERSATTPGDFALIFDRHVGDIRRFVLRRLGPDRCDDVVSEVFRIAFEQRETFDPTVASARPWLYGIAANLVRREHRTHVRHLAALRREHGRRRTSSDPWTEAASRVDASNAAGALCDALLELPDAERETLLLVAWEQLTPTEIASATDVPAATVRTRLRRARQHVRDRLDRGGDTEEASFHAN